MQRNTLHSPSSKHRARSLGSVHKSRSSFILELVVSPEGDKRSTPVRSFITDFDLFNSRTNVVRIWWAIASGRGRQYDPWKSSNDTTVVAENIGQPQFQEYPVRSHEDSSQACRPALKRNVTCIGMSVSFSHAAVASTSSRCWATVVRNKSLSEYLNLLGVVVFLSDVKQWRSLNVVHSAVWTPIRKTWFFHAASWTKHCPLKSKRPLKTTKVGTQVRMTRGSGSCRCRCDTSTLLSIPTARVPPSSYASTAELNSTDVLEVCAFPLRHQTCQTTRK